MWDQNPRNLDHRFFPVFCHVPVELAFTNQSCSPGIYIQSRTYTYIYTCVYRYILQLVITVHVIAIYPSQFVYTYTQIDIYIHIFARLPFMYQLESSRHGFPQVYGEQEIWNDTQWQIRRSTAKVCQALWVATDDLQPCPKNGAGTPWDPKIFMGPWDNQSTGAQINVRRTPSASCLWALPQVLPWESQVRPVLQVFTNTGIIPEEEVCGTFVCCIHCFM